MAQLSCEELLKVAHSPTHYAVARRDHSALRRIISSLPKLARAGEIRTEAESIREEQRADAIAGVIDRRDVPGRETPLHLAVRLSDPVSAELLMSAGANWSLQNEAGWSALQEAICGRHDEIAMVIMRHYQPAAWAKWCRRLPRLVACMRRMRDFYMEIGFQFESSVIPFVGRIAPSDTYRIWKRDANLRADTTLAGFDGFKIQRSDQSFLFLGEGSDDGTIAPGSLLMLAHKEKEIMNAFEDAGIRPSDAEVKQEAEAMKQTNVYRPGIDVTNAELVPQLNWRRQDKSEMVGSWKAKVYDMHHVMLSFKSRRVSGQGENQSNKDESEDYSELLTEDEKRQMEDVLKMGELELNGDVEDGFLVAERPADFGRRHSSFERGDLDFYVEKKERFSFSKSGNFELRFSSKEVKEEKGWVWGSRRSCKDEALGGGQKKVVGGSRSSFSIEEKVSDLLGPRSSKKPEQGRRSLDEGAGGHKKVVSGPRSSFSIEEKVSDLLGPRKKLEQGRRSLDVRRGEYVGAEDFRKKDGRKWAGKEVGGRRRGASSGHESSSHESVYKKGLRPVLWLTPHFPLRTEEMLPLLDILADKVKAVRRLRELLTTKLPSGTFPVKVAIPVVPTIRVVITFTKFEELPPSEEFCTPPSSPAHLQDLIAKESQNTQESSNSWFQWIKGSHSRNTAAVPASPDNHPKEVQDPFAIPSDYTWTTIDAKKRQMKEKKSKTRKGKRSNDITDNGAER